MLLDSELIRIGSYEESNIGVKNTIIEWGRTSPIDSQELIRWYVRYKRMPYDRWHATKMFDEYLLGRDFFEKLVLNGIRGATILQYR